MKALKIKVNFNTGARAGGINPRDKNLRCNPLWQNVQEGYEIRLVLDGNVTKYHGLPDVEILHDEESINAAVDALHPKAEDSYAVYDSALLAASIQSKKINLDGIESNFSQNAEAKALYERGALGIAKKDKPKPPKACDLCAHIVHKKK